jgi:hypothetical protein
MQVIDEVALARFNKTDDPADSPPGDALEAARHFLQSETGTEHIIVLVGRTMEDGSSGTRFFQAGKYPHHAVMGLCLEGMHMLRESR